MPQPKKCGCKIEYSKDLHNDKMVYIAGPHIVFCPLHEQAEKTLAAVAIALAYLREMKGKTAGLVTEIVDRAYKAAQQKDKP